MRRHGVRTVRELNNFSSTAVGDYVSASSFFGRLEKPSGKVTVSVHGASQDDAFFRGFEEQNVFVERPANHKEAPIGEPGMGESARWPKSRLLSQQVTRGFDRTQVKVRNFPIRLGYVPLKLPFDIRNEIGRFESRRDSAEAKRSRTRWRTPAKSSVVNLLAGWSADSRSQASNSGVIGKVCR